MSKNIKKQLFVQLKCKDTIFYFKNEKLEKIFFDLPLPPLQKRREDVPPRRRG